MGFWTIAAIALSIISGGASYVQAKKAAKLAKRAAKQGQGLLINSDGTNNFIPVIYGTRRIAGTRVFVATGDDPFGDINGILYLVYVLCEGEVDDITDILVDDLPVTDPRFSYTNSIRINKFYGTNVQTADNDFIAGLPGTWTSDHTLKGLAYITVRLKWNSNAFSSIPNITALVRGKKVYDPRTTLTGYSTNPALCIRDYLTNTRYGKGLVAADLDDQSFEDAADFYDNTVTFWTSGTVGKLFEFNAVIDTEQSILDNIKDMLFCCRGFLPYTNGVYQLIPDKSASSVFAFSTDNIIGGISVRGESKDDKYNKVILTFTDPNNSWQENTAIFPDADDTSYLTADNNVELVGDFDLPCITNYYAARDLARVFLLRSRNALRCGFNANSDALNLTVGDVVTVTHPTPGWSAKPFQVEEISINYDGTCRVALLEYDSSIYTYDPASEQLVYPDTDLPNPYFVVAPTLFVVTEITYLANDGTVVPEISVAWTESADAYVEYYEFQFKIDTDSEWLSFVTYEPIYVTTFATVGETYDIRARAVNSLGVQSAWLTGTYTVVGDTTAPAIPTGVTIAGDYNQVTATWSAATEKDYKESWVYQNTTGITPLVGDTPFLKVTGNTVTVSGLAVSTTYYVWVRNVDFSGNVSGFSSPGTFTTTAGASAVSVVAGGTIAGSVTTDGVAISTVRTNAATGKSISDTLLVSGTATLQGIIAPTTTGAVRTGTITWNSGTGALTGGTGVAITQWGIIGANAGVATFSIEATTGNAIFAGSITAGAVIAGSVTTDSVSLATIRTNAATGKSISDTLLVSGTAVLQGVIAPSTTGAIKTGTITWNTTTGALTGGTGIAITQWGIIGANAGVATFSVEATTGSAIFKGDITGASGTFSGSISTSNQLIATGSGTVAGFNAAIIGNASTAGVISVLGYKASGATVPAVLGYSASSNTGAGGVFGQTAVLGVPAVEGLAGAFDSGGLAGKFTGNVTVGDGATNTGIYNLIIKEGTVGSRLDNQMQIYGALSSDSDTTLGVVTEQGVVAGTGPLVGLTDQIKIYWNGAAYWLPLVPI